MSTKYDDSPLMNLTEKKVEVNFKKESQIKEVWRRLKKDKLAEEEKARKAAEQNAQRFEEQRGSDDGSHV